MMRASTAAIASLSLLPLLACCPGKTTPEPNNFPSAEQFVARLEAQQKKAVSFKALDTRMNFQDESQRVRTDVLVMGQRGAKIRFNALSPAGGSTIADLACDGISFAYEDAQNNCYLTGPCSGDAIAQLLRVRLEPDDFLDLATGSVPLIGEATAAVEWNAKNGTVVLKLLANDNQRSQEIILDGKNASYDVLEATVANAKGEVEWTVENKGFEAAKGADGATLRIPSRTRFQQPSVKGDVQIRWGKRELNLDPPIEPSAFQMQITPGIPECGAGSGSGSGSASR